MLTGRLVLAVISLILEEAALVVIVLWGLPRLDIHISIVGLIAMMIGWAVLAVVIYRAGSHALRRKPVAGLSDMVGSKGKVITPLSPRGIIRIGDELWDAQTSGRRIKTGEEVTVVGQDGLNLIVQKRSAVNKERRDDTH